MIKCTAVERIMITGGIKTLYQTIVTKDPCLQIVDMRVTDHDIINPGFMLYCREWYLQPQHGILVAEINLVLAERFQFLFNLLIPF